MIKNETRIFKKNYCVLLFKKIVDMPTFRLVKVNKCKLIFFPRKELKY